MDAGELIAAIAAGLTALGTGLGAGVAAGNKYRERRDAWDPTSLSPGMSGGVRTLAVTKDRVDRLEREVERLKEVRQTIPDLTDLRERVDGAEEWLRKVDSQVDEIRKELGQEGRALHDKLDRLKSQVGAVRALVGRLRVDR